MKKGLAVLAMVLVGGVGTLAADQAQPQLLLNGDGAIGVRTEPSTEAGHALGSLGAGLEYVPVFVPNLGFNVDYDYLAESKEANERDNDIDLSLRGFGPQWGSVTSWLQGGIGFNTTPNDVNGRYLAFVGPGVRWAVLPRLAIDGGVQYQAQTPKSAFVQSFAVTLGLSVPLDAPFSNVSGAASSDAAPMNMKMSPAGK